MNLVECFVINTKHQSSSWVCSSETSLCWSVITLKYKGSVILRSVIIGIIKRIHKSSNPADFEDSSSRTYDAFNQYVSVADLTSGNLKRTNSFYTWNGEGS